MNLRQAAQQALDALVEINKLSIGEHAVCLPGEIDTAMDALRAALAEHDSDYERGFVDGMNLQTKRSVDKAVNRIAEPEQEPVAIKWTLNGDKHCGYSNWLGETPFGRILITWKSWKDLSDACVDEFPGGFWAYGEPDEVKAQCEAEFCRRLGTAPTPRKPLTYDELEPLCEAFDSYDTTQNELVEFARAIERAHGIGEQHE